MLAAILIPQPSNATGNVLSGSGSPLNAVSATGAAVYIDSSSPSAPVVWVKSTAGTSSADWVIVGTFSNS